MKLPLKPPIKPQLALTRKQLPEGEEWAYEPKLDGFRAIVFVDGEESYIQSRGGKPLRRYFPELSFAARPLRRRRRAGDPRRRTASSSFDALQSRIHPAESRINLLAEEIPAELRRLRPARRGRRDRCSRRRLRERRERLEALAQARRSIELTPLTADPGEAEEWLRTIEGVIAKQLDAPYLPGQRKGMAKVKRERTIDCVVMGWRPGKEEGTVGSLILGLYDGDELRPVGHISGFTAKTKRSLREHAGAAGDRRSAAAPSRAAGPASATWSGSSCDRSW